MALSFLVTVVCLMRVLWLKKGDNKEGSYGGSGDLKPKPKPTKNSSDGGKGKPK